MFIQVLTTVQLHKIIAYQIASKKIHSKMGRIHDSIKTIWKKADAVCFDIDSTVCIDEAFDELAKFVGCEKVVSDLTSQAMKGEIPFHTSLVQRLDIVQPSVSIMAKYLKMNPPNLTPGIKELISVLQDREVPIYLISGGFDVMIEPVAEELSIPFDHIYANRLKFYFNGEYAGFDEMQPTCEQDGKAQVAAYLKHRYGYQRLVMIGDGVTDLVASPPADLVIGFGGNKVHEEVKKKAKWFVTSFDDLTEELL